MAFSIHSIYHQIFKVWRGRRFDLFLRTLTPCPTDLLLDVGGYPYNWTTRPQSVKRIDTVNVHEVPWEAEKFPNHNIRSLVQDGCSLSLPDRSYDIGFSNSVIEHVGTWERQQQFAAEIRRVAKSIWVQTPAYECPIEPHYLAPFIHYLPKTAQLRVVRWGTPYGWIQRPKTEEVRAMVESTRLLKKSEMQHLFPDCEIITERLLGVIPKSYIAVRRRANRARVPGA